jgi:hypothetical protein
MAWRFGTIVRIPRCPLSGVPVDAGDFADSPVNVRQRTVRAAILAFGRLLGTTIAHECDHALGLVGAASNQNVDNGGVPIDSAEIMNSGEFNTFIERTGITGFNSATGIPTVGAAVGFGDANLNTLREILPILGDSP